MEQSLLVAGAVFLLSWQLKILHHGSWRLRSRWLDGPANHAPMNNTNIEALDRTLSCGNYLVQSPCDGI